MRKFGHAAPVKTSPIGVPLNGKEVSGLKIFQERPEDFGLLTMMSFADLGALIAAVCLYTCWQVAEKLILKPLYNLHTPIH